jgi:hypothetical protein
MSKSPIKNTKIPGIIYGSILSTNSQIILDVRDTEKQIVSYFQLSLDSLKLDKLPVTDTSWWSKLMDADEEWLYVKKYTDRNDPNSQINSRIPLKSGNGDKSEEIMDLPSNNRQLTYPSLYENGTEYHKMVSDFLGLALPLSCEYLEWNDKIIISYYLRSDDAFDRFLLLLDNGKKEWKLHQDQKMKGFSPEAFFIHDNELIFIKDLNEVCIYTL